MASIESRAVDVRSGMCRVVVALLPLALAACESDYITIAPDVGSATTRLRPVESVDCSYLALAWPPYAACVPWGWDERAQKAYGTAVASVPGATALDAVIIREDWQDWGLVSVRKLTIRGDAVKP